MASGRNIGPGTLSGGNSALLVYPILAHQHQVKQKKRETSNKTESQRYHDTLLQVQTGTTLAQDVFLCFASRTTALAVQIPHNAITSS
jgi:hypothetical protein